MKVFIAGLDTETNTFAPIPTGQRASPMASSPMAMRRGSPKLLLGAAPGLAPPRRGARLEVAESLCAFAEPGGTVVRGVYERLRDEILAISGRPCRSTW